MNIIAAVLIALAPAASAYTLRYKVAKPDAEAITVRDPNTPMVSCYGRQ